MKRFCLLCLAVLMLTLSGCGYREGVVIRDDAAWLNFTGSLRGAEFSVDGGESVLITSLKPSPKKDKKSSNKDRWFRVEPGKHRIVVTREGKVLVERELLLGNHQTREIYIP